MINIKNLKKENKENSKKENKKIINKIINKINKKIVVKLILFTVILIIIYCLLNKYILNEKYNENMINDSYFGNNSSSQEIENKVLNITSYTLKCEVEIANEELENSKYIVMQNYLSPNILTQEIIEPSNIAGLKITKNENNEVIIENTKLSLSKVITNYNYIDDNALDLISFIDEYENISNTTYLEEDENYIIMNVEILEGNKYTKNRSLYIDKENGSLTKLEIKDDSKNITMYILYKEQELN